MTGSAEAQAFTPEAMKGIVAELAAMKSREDVDGAMRSLHFDPADVACQAGVPASGLTSLARRS